jgi:hypothetical protein
LLNFDRYLSLFAALDQTERSNFRYTSRVELIEKERKRMKRKRERERGGKHRKKDGGK